MLVTCPECKAKISDESKECRVCGSPYAGRRSKEFCEHLVKNFSWPFIWSQFIFRKHFENQRHSLWDFLNQDGDVDQYIRKYIKIVRIFVCNYAHGPGYQVELALECKCGQKFASHINPQEGLLVEGYFRAFTCGTCTRKV